MQSQLLVGFCFALMLSFAVGIDGIAQEATGTPSGELLPVLTACTQDGEFYLHASWDGRIKLVRLADGLVVRTIYHCNPTAAVFSPGGTHIATAGLSNGRPAKVKIWSVADGKFVREIETEVHSGIQLSFSPDSKYLASSASDSRVNLWDVTTGARKNSIEAKANVTRLFFSKRGEILVIIHRDGGAQLIPVEQEAK